mmetsp:Transcript_13043/g.36464  ORF Transcript_13043/g.36464 Transcript_13043/m.36464 type:complete len:302 (+) Transcript_13043:21-926(+)
MHEMSNRHGLSFVNGHYRAENEKGSSRPGKQLQSSCDREPRSCASSFVPRTLENSGEPGLPWTSAARGESGNHPPVSAKMSANSTETERIHSCSFVCTPTPQASGAAPAPSVQLRASSASSRRAAFQAASVASRSRAASSTGPLWNCRFQARKMTSPRQLSEASAKPMAPNGVTKASCPYHTKSAKSSVTLKPPKHFAKRQKNMWDTTTRPSAPPTNGTRTAQGSAPQVVLHRFATTAARWSSQSRSTYSCLGACSASWFFSNSFWIAQPIPAQNIMDVMTVRVNIKLPARVHVSLSSRFK